MFANFVIYSFDLNAFAVELERWLDKSKTRRALGPLQVVHSNFGLALRTIDVPSGLSVNRKPLRLTRENRPAPVVNFLITDNSDLVPLLVMRARWFKSDLAARFRLFMRLDVKIGKQHILAL